MNTAPETPSSIAVVSGRLDRQEPKKTGLPSNLQELEWSDTGTEASGDPVRGIERCLAPGRDPLPVAPMIWAGEHGYVLLRDSMSHFPFPDPAAAGVGSRHAVKSK